MVVEKERQIEEDKWGRCKDGGGGEERGGDVKKESGRKGTMNKCSHIGDLDEEYWEGKGEEKKN